jgi:hypothetical protein
MGGTKKFVISGVDIEHCDKENAVVEGSFEHKVFINLASKCSIMKPETS